MTKTITALFFICFSCELFSCISKKNVSGTYRSNFAALGSSTTRIKLRQDSSFEYIFNADLQHDSSGGNYKIRRKNLYLTFDKEIIDSNKLYSRFNDMPFKTVVYSNDTINYDLLYYIGHNKLFITNLTTGNKMTQAIKEHKVKRFIFFGNYGYNKRYFLKRIK